MADLATTYANTCGVKLPKKPAAFPTNFFPVPNKYITLHAGAGHDARRYAYYQEVINLLLPYLRENKIHVLQIGQYNEEKIEQCVDLRSKTDIRQGAHIVENALLHLGNDSAWTHIAGAKNTPVVALFAPNPTEVARPHYHGKLITLEPEIKYARHTFAVEEFPRQIDSIKPESVANSVLELLNLGKINIETVNIGFRYLSSEVDFIPNCIPPKFEGVTVNVRFDKCPDYGVAHRLIGNMDIVCDSEIPMEFLNQNKGRIRRVFYELKKPKKEFVNFLDKSGIDYCLFIKKENEENLPNLKLEFFDYKPIYTQENFDFSKFNRNMWAKTTRVIYGSGHFYASYYHYKKNIHFDGKAFQIGDAFDDPEFWTTADNYYIYNKNEIT